MALLLRTKAGDRVQIGPVTIEVKRATEDNLRIAISAPPDLIIDYDDSRRLAEERKIERFINDRDQE